MKILSALVMASAMLAGCISSGSPNPPAKTTVVVPANSTTTVVCQDGTKPPCT
jgi:outer membrane murein-binding lipoprotein Lpp